MSGYTPIFRSVFQGSLCGKYPDLPVWLVLLALADKHGEVDAHPSYIAMVSGLPQPDIEAAIAKFCEPDNSSRTSDDDGRRLIPLPNRGFGWTITNHSKYREKARLAAKSEREVESGRNAERLQHRRGPPETADDRRSPPVTDPSDADANTEKRARKRASRRCPPEFEPDREYALKEIPDLDVDRELARFRDFEFKTPRSDWAAGWRNWIRTCRESGRYAKKSAIGKINPGEWR